MSKIAHMPKKSGDKPKKGMEKYRKPFRPTRVREPVAELVDVMAEDWGVTFAAAVHRIIVERLKSDGLWPPKPRTGTPGDQPPTE